MKSKSSVILLFALACMLLFGGNVFADIALVAGAASTNTIDKAVSGRPNVVLTSFTATEGVTPTDYITNITLDNAGGASGLGTELTRLALYVDVNQDGKYDSGDTLVEGAEATAGLVNYNAGGPAVVTLTPTNPIQFTAGEVKYFLVVANMAKTITDNNTFGVIVTGTVNSGIINTVTQAAKTFAVVASHLRFTAAGLNYQAASGGSLIAGADGTVILSAVDDNGNLDVDFADTAQLSLEDYMSGVDATGGLTSTEGGGGSVVSGGAAFLAIADGTAKITTAAVGGDLKTLTVGANGNYSLVAKTVTNKLEGSQAICIAAAYPAPTGVSLARGIEIYDTDHNGFIDHATIFFDGPVQITGALNGTYFTISGGYSIAAVEAQPYDAGGTGIRNAGQFGITLRITEKSTYDTNATPDVTFNGGGGGVLIEGRDAGTTDMQAFTSAQAVEVDKARPVLISAITKDLGYGTGTAQNGILDGIVFTFSEPVRNVTAGPQIADGTSYIALAIPVSFGLSFNQGSGSSSGNVVTIPVGETTINTGVVPDIVYNENWASARITDSAKAATGANAYNSYYATNTSFSKGNSSGAVDANDPLIKTTDGAPMVIHSVETRDLNNNGKIDRMLVTFSENTSAGATTTNGVDFYSSIAAFASTNLANGVYKPTGVGTVTGAGTPTLTFTIDEVTVAGVYDTEATPSFRYDPTATGASIADAVGNKLGAYGPGGLAHPATKDGAKPVIISYTTADAYADTNRTGDSAFESAVANGRIDGIKIVFSEKVKTGSGAQSGGTALDNMVGQFTITHNAGGGARTAIATTATLGKPTWSDVDSNGDTRTEVTVSFQEVSHVTIGAASNYGDTGATVTLTYAASGTTAYNVIDYAAEANYLYTTLPGASLDGAAPFIVQGIGKSWHASAFANIQTKDTGVTAPAPVRAGVSNNADGDGWIDGFVLKFSEAVNVGAGAASAFTTALTGGGALGFSAIAGTGTNTLTITGTPDKKGAPDTDQTPLLAYNKDNLVLTDGTGNKVASFADAPSYDMAPPVIVGVNGDLTNSTKLNITFSEPVYTHAADGTNISFNAASLSSSQLFGYDNLGTGPGASGFTAAVVTQPGSKVIQATLNAALTVVDIQNDLTWVRITGIFDNANIIEDGLADNVTPFDVAGANIKFWIMDDVIAPWIIGAQTVDYNKNGKIDHIKITLSEPIVDSSIKGFVADNAMSSDVSATWKLTGYSGPLYWNFLDGTTNDGKAASIALGKPAFGANAKNDAVLYLALDEELVPTNINTGVGSTGYKPTITWGTGANAETLGDARPNVLDTASTENTATNGTVTDVVGPVIVGATLNGKVITVQFSEDLKTPGDIKNAENFLVDGNTGSSKIWGVTKVNNSTWDLTMKSDYGFSAAAATTVQVNQGNILANPALASMQDAAGNAAGLAVDVVEGLWVANSPASVAPYTASTTTRGAFKVSNNSWIAVNTISDATPHAGEAVTLTWTYQNIENVDLWISYNGAESYELVNGTTTPASAKTLTWTAKLGVTNVKIQASSNAGLNCSWAVTPTYDGSSVGASVGAPSGLTITDVPNDNGGFVYAQFVKSPDHLTAVNSYQFYRKVTIGTAETWVQWATVQAGAPDDDGKLTVILPTMWNGTAQWAVRASTGVWVSNQAAAKEAAIPVADVVYGSAEKEASNVVISALSEVAEGGSVDDIAPSAVTDAKALDNAGAGTGILISWTAPADNGIVGTYVIGGQTNYIYGVESYDIYRKAMGSTGDYVLVGSATHGATSYTDMVADGAAAYNYIIKATDGTFVVPVTIPGNAMAGNGTPDFDNSGSVSLGDLVLLGKVWGLKSTDAGFIANFDLNNDGTIGLGDLVMLGNSWTSSTKSAKLAPMQSVALDMSAELNEATSMYYVTIGSKDALEGLAFTLNYDTNLYEFVKESVTGLGSVSVANEMKAGVIDIASVYGNEKFSGAITLGFKSKGKTGDMNIQLANTEVSLNGVLGSVNDQTMVLKALPTVYSLGKNFPNPFNPTTTIEYSIPVAGQTNLVIYNLAGQKVRTLVNSVQAPSFYKVVWDGKNDNGMTVATGTYFYKLVSGNYSKTVKMTLVK